MMALLKSSKKKRAILRHYLGEGDLAAHRFHLRSDTENEGVLVVDSSKMIRLNGTALDFTALFLEGLSDEQVVKKIRRKYKKVKKDKVRNDYLKFKEKLVGVINDDEKVVTKIQVEPMDTDKLTLSAPYRMDLALTYKCQNKCCHCYNEPKRDVKELEREKWIEVLDKLWDIGVPHIVFTGGEPTLRDELPELIAHAEKNGQITGLITNGRKMADMKYLNRLVEAGLDHVQITLESFNSKTHDEITGFKGAWQETVAGIKNAQKTDIYLSTNTTVLDQNKGEIPETVQFISGLGVENVALNGVIRAGSGKDSKAVTLDELSKLLPEVKEIAVKENLNFVWYTPTPYCELNPVNMDLGIKQCTACIINMAVEPNGDVLPCQSYYEPLGNLLSDPWDSIWNNTECQNFRNRAYVPEKCTSCRLLDVCGGACPLSWKAGDYICLDRHSSG
jgi:radical SAM protein with 4Fe4S-binding SPASM domain